MFKSRIPAAFPSGAEFILTNASPVLLIGVIKKQLKNQLLPNGHTFLPCNCVFETFSCFFLVVSCNASPVMEKAFQAVFFTLLKDQMNDRFVSRDKPPSHLRH